MIAPSVVQPENGNPFKPGVEKSKNGIVINDNAVYMMLAHRTRKKIKHANGTAKIELRYEVQNPMEKMIILSFEIGEGWGSCNCDDKCPFWAGESCEKVVNAA